MGVLYGDDVTNRGEEHALFDSATVQSCAMFALITAQSRGHDFWGQTLKIVSWRSGWILTSGMMLDLQGILHRG